MTSIALSRVHKIFDDHEAVIDLSLSVPERGFLVLLGPSGCGKTTTLRMIAGLEDPTAGTISLGERIVADGDRGVSVPASKRGLGMVFQSYALWPHMTVRQNVEWPLKVAGWSSADRVARVKEVLESLSIMSLAERTPAEISGGQQQRVAIARTIAAKPAVVLFDEPLSNLDARLRVETRAEIGRVHRASGATSVYVTHDQVEALALATHIAVMNKGKLEQFGTPQELLENPQSAFVAGFLGSPAAVLLPVRSLAGRLLFGDVQIAASCSSDAVAQVMYRPEEIAIASDGEIDFEILESTPQAGAHVVSGVSPSAAAADAGRRITIVADRPATPGDAVRLRLPVRPAAFFDAEGKRL